MNWTDGAGRRSRSRTNWYHTLDHRSVSRTDFSGGHRFCELHVHCPTLTLMWLMSSIMGSRAGISSAVSVREQGRQWNYYSHKRIRIRINEYVLFCHCQSLEATQTTLEKTQSRAQAGKHTAAWMHEPTVQLGMQKAPRQPSSPAHHVRHVLQLGNRDLGPGLHQQLRHLGPVLRDDQVLHAPERVARQRLTGLHLLHDVQRLLPTLRHELRGRHDAVHPGVLSGKQQQSRRHKGMLRHSSSTAAGTFHSGV